MKNLIFFPRGFFIQKMLVLLFLVGIYESSFAQQGCHIIGKPTICNSINPSGTYSIQPTDAIVEWEATPNGIITPQDNYTIDVEWPAATGTYLVTANLYYPNGNTDHCELEVSIGDQIVDVSISPERVTICPGESVEFVAESDCDNCIFDWGVSNNLVEGIDYDFVSINDHIATIVFHTPNISNGYVHCIVSNSSGCSQSAYSSVTTTDVPNPSFDVIEGTVNANYIDLCNGQEVFFNNTTNGYFLYTWQIIEIASNQEWNYFTEDLSFNFPNTGLYSVTLISYDSRLPSCSHSITQTINVQEGIPIPIICPSVVCENQIVTYEVEENCTGEYSWTIIQPDGTESTETGNPISVNWSLEGSSFGTGYVIFHPDGCPSNFCAEPSVHEVPIFPTEFEMTGSESVCNPYNNTQYYSLPSAIPGANYNWGVEAISTYSGSFIESIYLNFLTVTYKDATDQSLFNGVVRIWVEVEHPIAGCVGYAEKIVEVIQGNITGPQEICIGDEASYEYSPDPGRPINWSLSLNDVEVLTSTSGGTNFTIPSTALTETGEYTISTVVSDDQGINCTRSTDLMVREAPPLPEIEGQVYICPGTPYHYSITNCNSPSSIEWTINNGGVISTQTACSIDVVWAATGPYSISAVQHIYIQGEIACSSSPTHIEINTGIPEVEILPNENPCPNSIVEYQVSPTGWTSYEWIPPANGSLASPNGTSSISIQWFDVETPTPDVLSVKVNNNECIPPVTLDVMITPFELEINASDICVDEQLIISSNATSADSYKWFVNNEFASGNENLNYTFPTSGFYNIRLEVLNPNGCPGLYKKAITIYAHPNPSPVISRTIRICREDGTLNGSLAVTPNSPDYTYQWYLNDVAISGANSPTQNITEVGNYTVTVDYGLCQNSASIPVQCIEDECNCMIAGDADVHINNPNYDESCGSISFSGSISPLSNVALANWRIEGPGNYNHVINIQSEDDLDISDFQLPQIAGLYTIYLEACIPCANSDECCTISDKHSIAIPFIPYFDFNFNCAGEETYELTLVDLSSYYVSSNNVDIQWDVNGNIYSGSTVTITGLMPGTTANVSLQISSIDHPTYSCDLSQAIDLPQSINGGFTVEGGLCADQTITFTPAMDIEELLEWEWIFDDENTLLNYSPMLSFEEAGTHQVTLNITSTYGCTSQYTEMITLGAPLEGAIEKNMENCDATAILGYNQTSGHPLTDYLWGPSNETNSTIEVMETGIYTVTVTNTEGCVAIASTAVDLDNPLLNGINGDPEKCEGEYATLYVTANPNYDFEWDISPCPVGTCPISGNSINLTNWAPNTYTVTVKALQGGEECLSETTTLVVHDVPEFTINQDVTQCEPFSAILETEFTDGENNGIIEWSNSSLGIPTGITGTTFIASQNGSYNANYTDNITGCTVSASIEVEEDIDFSLFPIGCYDYCTDELAESPINIPGIHSCNSTYEWQINYGNGYEVLTPPGIANCEVPFVTIAGLPEGETEAKIRLSIDNGTCVEESEDFCITVEECCETCPKVLNLRCEEILANGDVVFAIDGDLACLPDGYEFCGTPPVITNGGYLDIDEESVVIYEPPMFNPLYWFAGNLVVTNFDYFVANGGLEAEIDICNESGTCKAQFFIEYENGGGDADIRIDCMADPSECDTDIYDFSAAIPIPLGWSYCGDELMVDGGYIEINSISNTCDLINLTGRLFVTAPAFYQSNQGLDLGINICQGGEMQTVTAQIPYESCDDIWPYPYELTSNCIENQNVVELCLFTPYFTACNPCEEQPLDILILPSNPLITLYSGTLGASEGDYECIEFVVPESGNDVDCINFLVSNDCYGSSWSVCYGTNCGDNEGLGVIETRQIIGKQEQDLTISFDLVPNPANNQVNVQFITTNSAQDSEGEILLQDIFGRTYIEKTVQLQDGHNIQLGLSNLAAGVYWVILKNETGLLQAKKLVKF